jgi:hypothetical protein
MSKALDYLNSYVKNIYSRFLFSNIYKNSIFTRLNLR